MRNNNTVCLPQKDIFKQATEDRLTSAKELPYFEGDFWPNVLEESIKELEQEEEERKKEENTASSETTEVSLMDTWIQNIFINERKPLLIPESTAQCFKSFVSPQIVSFSSTHYINAFGFLALYKPLCLIA